MKKIVSGNAINEGELTRGWFIGSFIDSVEDLKKNKDVELKWGIHPSGEFRESKAVGGEATSIGILISGKYQIDFDNETFLLEKPGDYVMWNPNQAHKCHSYEDSVILTVRWPSLSAEKN